MQITVLTIFPELFDAFWRHGMIRRAIEQNRITAEAVNIRDFADGRHRVTDDRPYGGGNGMVMKPEPLARAIRAAKKTAPNAVSVLLTPRGTVFSQDTAARLSSLEQLILVCGRYEGVDERICQDDIDLEISVGDFVLTGGEVAAMIVIDAAVRLIPGVLGGSESAEKDSFSQNLLEHDHYTRPPDFEGKTVPDVLLSGNHQAIERWRREMSLIRTLLKRPDLLMNRPLDREAVEMLGKWGRTIERIADAQALRRADPPPGVEPEG